VVDSGHNTPRVIHLHFTMPPKSRAKRAPTAQRRRQPAPGRRNPRKTHVTSLAHMVSDPCGSTLTPGLYGSAEGLLARFENSTFNSNVSTCGYVVWIPVYHNDPQETLPSTNTGVNGNIYIWTSADPATIPPDNMGLAPLWSVGTTTQSSASFPDPAARWIASGTAMDARTLSACMKVKFTGQLRTDSGEICWLNNISPKVLFGEWPALAPSRSQTEPYVQVGPSGCNRTEAKRAARLAAVDAGSFPASVNALFDMSPNSERLGLDTYENVYSAVSQSDAFYPYDAGYQLVPDGYPGQGADDLSRDNARPEAFGFAWRGIDNEVDGYAGNNALRFDFVKNVEWRPNPYLGISTPVRRVLGQNPQPFIAAALDTHAPGWNHKKVDENGASSLAETAYTGVARAIKGASSFAGFVEKVVNIGLPFMAQKASGLLTQMPEALMLL